MLKWNSGKVRNLTGVEIWMFIIGRVLAAFGLGVLGVRYFGAFVSPLGFSALVVGLVLLLIAAKCLLRPNPS